MCGSSVWNIEERCLCTKKISLRRYIGIHFFNVNNIPSGGFFCTANDTPVGPGFFVLRRYTEKCSISAAQKIFATTPITESGFFFFHVNEIPSRGIF